MGERVLSHGTPWGVSDNYGPFSQNNVSYGCLPRPGPVLSLGGATGNTVSLVQAFELGEVHLKLVLESPPWQLISIRRLILGRPAPGQV